MSGESNLGGLVRQSKETREKLQSLSLHLQELSPLRPLCVLAVTPGTGKSGQVRPGSFGEKVLSTVYQYTEQSVLVINGSDYAGASAAEVLRKLSKVKSLECVHMLLYLSSMERPGMFGVVFMGV